MPKPSKKTLIIHIGDHKTGSTSIQTAFAQRQVKLHDHSIFYPAKLANNVMRDQCRNYGAAETPEARELAAQPFRRMANRIRKSNADFTLISAEALERIPAALLHEIVDNFFAKVVDEVRIISYVRPHPGRITSTFTERTKVGVPKALSSTLEEFAERRKADGEAEYLPRFAAWREHFGDRFLLRPMIRAHLRDGDVVHDFTHHAFGGIPFEIRDASAVNESLYMEDLMRLKVLQMNLRMPRLLRLMAGWEVYRLIGQMPPPATRTRLQLHRSLAEDIRDTYLQDARDMDRMFFDGKPLMENELQAAVDKAIDTPQSTDPADHLPASELRTLELMSRMIAGLLENKDVDWPAFLHGKRIQDVKDARQDAEAAQ